MKLSAFCKLWLTARIPAIVSEDVFGNISETYCCWHFRSSYSLKVWRYFLLTFGSLYLLTARTIIFVNILNIHCYHLFWTHALCHVGNIACTQFESLVCTYLQILIDSMLENTSCNQLGMYNFQYKEHINWHGRSRREMPSAIYIYIYILYMLMYSNVYTYIYIYIPFCYLCCGPNNLNLFIFFRTREMERWPSAAAHFVYDCPENI